MEYTRLGRSGLTVSTIAYGNWLTHGSQVEADTAVQCVRAALDAGIIYFDTADVYAAGRAETVLGKALKGVPRKDLVIASKVYFPFSKKPNDHGLGRKHIIESCHDTLTRLGTDHLDIYYAHRFDDTVPLEETVAAFEHLVRAGDILYPATSQWTAANLTAGLAEISRIGGQRYIVNQPEYNMLQRYIEPEIVPLCRREGISQAVFSPIAQGVLTGKYKPGQPAPAGSRATDSHGGASMISRNLREPLLERVQRLAPLAEQAGITLAQLAVAWTLHNDNVACAIVGASRPEQIAENAAAADVTLDADLLVAIDEILGDEIVYSR